jgi:hypothetical protein
MDRAPGGWLDGPPGRLSSRVAPCSRAALPSFGTGTRGNASPKGTPSTRAGEGAGHPVIPSRPPDQRFVPPFPSGEMETPPKGREPAHGGRAYTKRPGRDTKNPAADHPRFPAQVRVPQRGAVQRSQSRSRRQGLKNCGSGGLPRTSPRSCLPRRSRQRQACLPSPLPPRRRRPAFPPPCECAPCAPRFPRENRSLLG